MWSLAPCSFQVLVSKDCRAVLSHPVATLHVAAERLQCGKSELRCVRSVKYTLDCVDML